MAYEHKKWHFQLFSRRKYSGPNQIEIMFYDSQTSVTDKVKCGFGSRLKAEREAAHYAEMAVNPLDENPITSVRINTFQVWYTDLPASHAVSQVLERVNDNNALPRIVYPD